MTKITVDFRILAAMARHIAGNDLSRYYFNGVNLSVVDGKMFAVVTDGHSMVVMNADCDKKLDDFNVIIPNSFFRILDLSQCVEDDQCVNSEDWPEMPEPRILELEFSGNTVTTILDGLMHSAGLIDHVYPNWKSVVARYEIKGGLTGYSAAKLISFQNFATCAGIAFSTFDAGCYISCNGKDVGTVHFDDERVIGFIMPIKLEVLKIPEFIKVIMEPESAAK